MRLLGLQLDDCAIYVNNLQRAVYLTAYAVSKTYNVTLSCNTAA